MSKIIYVCGRGSLPVSTAKRLREICQSITPDNITPRDPKIVVENRSAFGICNPANTILEKGKSVLLGKLFGEESNWHEIGKEDLDGSFALFRDTEKHLDILSDPIGSRTIWYYADSQIFVSSTSQRAITMFIGSFQFDEKTIPWVLSTGTLGPSFAWDRRIEFLPPDSSVTLDKEAWTISKKSTPIRFAPTEGSMDHHKHLLRQSLETTFESLSLDNADWILPLSGGFDSRAIACLLVGNGRAAKRLETVTWGLESSRKIRGNDARVASELATALGLSNTYYPTDRSPEPVHKTIDRFMLLGEGRIDHLSGYMDGFSIWKTLFNNGVQGVVRGDEGFGSLDVSSELSVRQKTGCRLCSDIPNLADYRKYGFEAQQLPENLLRKKGETLATWRDRLYHEFRLPTALSALSDLKLPYVELINPLLSRKILETVRKLPDELRTDKALFKQVVTSLSPNVGFATDVAIALPENILRQSPVVEYMRSELSSKSARAVFPNEFLLNVLAGLRIEEKADYAVSVLKTAKRRLRPFVPDFVKRAVKSSYSEQPIDPNTLAFRVCLISKMVAILNDDAGNSPSQLASGTKNGLQ